MIEIGHRDVGKDAPRKEESDKCGKDGINVSMMMQLGRRRAIATRFGMTEIKEKKDLWALESS